MTRKYFKRGIYVAITIAICLALLYLVITGFAFDGKYGGFFPGVSAPRSCSFWHYMSGDVLAIAMIVAITGWPLMLAIVILPPAVGYWLDRRKRDYAA
ncbi:MAG: hypothetical protein ABIS45_17090 [Burkholderiales bacterium]